MPYANKEKQREAQKLWARTHRVTTGRHRTSARRKTRKLTAEIKETTPCVDCGESYPYYVMQFDHIPGKEKLGCIATMVGKNAAWEKIKEEILKCDIVCANCHAERTYKRRVATKVVTQS